MSTAERVIALLAGLAAIAGAIYIVRQVNASQTGTVTPVTTFGSGIPVVESRDPTIWQ